MKQINGDKQMTDVWRLPAIGVWEKSCGKHPTQKPLRLLTRLILASTDKGDWVFDPFCGSGTTGIAANLCERRFAGIEQELDFCEMTKTRRMELDNIEERTNLIKHIDDLKFIHKSCFASEDTPFYGSLPFENWVLLFSWSEGKSHLRHELNVGDLSEMNVGNLFYTNLLIDNSIQALLCNNTIAFLRYKCRRLLYMSPQPKGRRFLIYHFP